MSASDGWPTNPLFGSPNEMLDLRRIAFGWSTLRNIQAATRPDESVKIPTGFINACRMSAPSGKGDVVISVDQASPWPQAVEGVHFRGCIQYWEGQACLETVGIGGFFCVEGEDYDSLTWDKLQAVPIVPDQLKFFRRLD